ncbi:MAG TPA: hypothetical protein VLH12_08490 [Usitatibacter sp.]|nr:hypothetical protein [Usitatibacter sp.]
MSGDQRASQDRSRDALERARGCIKGLLARTPVRDVEETLAEIDYAIKCLPQGTAPIGADVLDRLNMTNPDAAAEIMRLRRELNAALCRAQSGGGGAQDAVEFIVDESRVGCEEYSTGIYVRAKRGTRWGSYDIAELAQDSLIAWLRSRGGSNEWAERVVLILLDYEVTPNDPDVPLREGGTR